MSEDVTHQTLNRKEVLAVAVAPNMILAKYTNKIHGVTDASGRCAFRGQQNADWPLRPSSIRRLVSSGIREDDPSFIDEYLDYHRQLLDRARRVIPYGQSSPPNTSLQLLAKVQHFGAATGLLDFTWNPLVALWFACEDTQRDGKLFVVSDEPARTRFLNPEEEKEIEKIFSKANDPADLDYFLWEPMFEGDATLRMVAQRSVFVIGRPMVPEEHFRTVVISASDKDAIRAELELLDISRTSIYRDLVGFCESESVSSVYIPPNTVRSYLRQANREYRRGEYAAAVETYGKCIEREPTSNNLYFLRGNAKAALDLYEEAVEDYDQAVVEFSPRWLLLAMHYNRGNMNSCLGRYENAIEDYRKAVAIDPHYRLAHFNCANAYFKLRRFQEAVLSFDRALEVDAKDLSSLSNKALALVLLGRFADAKDCYRQLEANKQMTPATNQNRRALEEITTLVGEPNVDDVMISAENDALTVRVTSSCYQGEIRFFPFVGSTGNAGNIGGPGLLGGEGFTGDVGPVVWIMPRPA